MAKLRALKELPVYIGKVLQCYIFSVFSVANPDWIRVYLIWSSHISRFLKIFRGCGSGARKAKMAYKKKPYGKRAEQKFGSVLVQNIFTFLYSIFFHQILFRIRNNWRPYLGQFCLNLFFIFICLILSVFFLQRRITMTFCRTSTRPSGPNTCRWRRTPWSI